MSFEPRWMYSHWSTVVNDVEKRQQGQCCCHLLREVLVVVLVTSSAFSPAKFCVFPYCLKEAGFVGLHWWRWQDYTNQRPRALSVSWSPPTLVTETRATCPVLSPGIWVQRFPQPVQWLVVIFVAAPTCLTLWRTPAGSARRTHSNSAADPAARGGGPAGCSSQYCATSTTRACSHSTTAEEEGEGHNPLR